MKFSRAFSTNAFRNLVLYIQDVPAAATRWHGIFLAGSDAHNVSRLTLAEDAIVIADRNEGKLELHLRNGSVHEVALDNPGQYSLSAFGQRDWPIDAGGFGKTQALAPTLNELSTRALAQVRGSDWLSARLEINRRFAFPAACIAFALIAVPLGARPRRGGRAGGFVVMLLLVCGYYALFVFGDRLARTGYPAPRPRNVARRHRHRRHRNFDAAADEPHAQREPLRRNAAAFAHVASWRQVPGSKARRPRPARAASVSRRRST